jgi:hypothetical protein
MSIGLKPGSMQRSKMRDIERDYRASFGGRPEELRFIALAKPANFGGRDYINSCSTKRGSDGRVDIFVREESSCAQSPDASANCFLTVASSSAEMDSSISSAWS